MILLLKELTELKKKSKYGKKDQPITIACKLLSYKDKVKVLQNYKWFKGCHIYISEYFCHIYINEYFCQATLQHGKAVA